LTALAPLACGLALLGLLGSGPRSDLAAHFFGFVAGIVMGAAYGKFIQHPLQTLYQVISIGFVVFLISVAWFAGGKPPV
jgi:membrane associated rhomboid family serine protease